MRKKIKTHIIFLFLAHVLLSQQDPAFNYYMFNHQSVNPAYVGSKNYTTITSVYRSQWSGFEGSPITQTASFNKPIRSKNIGVGLGVINDKIGPLTSTDISIDLSYHLRLNRDDSYLSVGLKFSGLDFGINNDMIQTNQPFDQTFLIQDDKSFFPNIGFGFYYYSQKIYLGFAMPRAIDHAEIGNQKHYFFIGGGLINISDLWLLRPSLFLKYARGSSSVYDFSSLLIFKEIFWIGGQIRSSIFSVLPDGGLEGSYAFLTGVNINENISIGYSYGFSSSKNKALNLGTHEIILRLDILPKVIGLLRSPRFF